LFVANKIMFTLKEIKNVTNKVLFNVNMTLFAVSKHLNSTNKETKTVE